MAYSQIAVVANNTSSVALGADVEQARHYLYIKNYSTSADTMWVSIGGTAAAGGHGEIQLLPGDSFTWGGDYREGAQPTQTGNNHVHYSPNCPQGSVNVFSAAGAQGCIHAISYPGA